MEKDKVTRIYPCPQDVKLDVLLTDMITQALGYANMTLFNYITITRDAYSDDFDLIIALDDLIQKATILRNKAIKSQS
jgi:hypothetical protein